MPKFDREKFKKMVEKSPLFLDDKKLIQEKEMVSTKLGTCIHFCVMTGKSFMRNKCLVRASALAYTTILALIPLLAVMVIISTALLKQESDKRIDELIDQFIGTVAPQLAILEEAHANLTNKTDSATVTVPIHDGSPSEVSIESTESESPGGKQMAVDHIKSFIHNVDSGQLGMVATISIVIVAISLLSTIENTFNDMWGVSKGRNFMNRVMRYWTAITLGPVCLISAIAITTGSRFEKTQEWIESLPVLGALFFKLIPLAIIATGFSILYKVVPNTLVTWRAAFMGGGVAGVLWQINNLLSVIYVARVTTYSKIYGSISLVPVFLLALYFSWLILLFGSQVAYSFQNRKIYLLNIAADNVNQIGNEFVAVRIMAHIARSFLKGEIAPTSTQIAKQLDIASRLSSRLIRRLCTAGLLAEVNHQDEMGYAPSRPLNDINLAHILRSMRELEGIIPMTKEGTERDHVKSILQKLKKDEHGEASSIDLNQLAQAAS